MVRVYLDNVIASGRVVKDLHPDEMSAIKKIEFAHNEKRLKRVTSDEAWREQEDNTDPARRLAFFEARAEVSAMATPDTILGAHREPSSSPNVRVPLYAVIDASLLDDLKTMGLKDADARHLRNAVRGECDFFLTLDSDFLKRVGQLHTRCPAIRILKPTELVTELGL
jgi:predicted nucleic acid-binding protein